MSIYWLFFIAVIVFWLLSHKSQPASFSARMSLKEAKFIIALVAKVAKSDGKVNQAEAELITQILDDLKILSGSSNEQREELKQIYSTEKDNVLNAFSLATQYKKRFLLSKETCVNRVYFLLNLAYIDGEFSAAERKIITQICDGFGIDELNKRAIFAKFDEAYRAQNDYRYSSDNDQNYSSPKRKDPYDVLGISKNSPFEQIKSRYRELVKKYHPDILMGKGADSQIIQEGTKRLQEINEAYEAIKQEFGK